MHFLESILPRGPNSATKNSMKENMKKVSRTASQGLPSFALLQAMNQRVLFLLSYRWCSYRTLTEHSVAVFILSLSIENA